MPYGTSIFCGRMVLLSLAGLTFLAIWPVIFASAGSVGSKSEDSKKNKTGFDDVIRIPEEKPLIHAEVEGTEVFINCMTCHTILKPDPTTNSAAQMDRFHQGTIYAHGNLTCLSCHNEKDYGTLKRSNGEAIAFRDVMQLCAQCHSSQMRDYIHGAHGGMTGYWDRTVGARQRNNCVDCHDPHNPKFRSMKPAAGPRDRFLNSHTH